MADRIAGRVKWYDAGKCYGWLVGEDAAEYYLHRSEIEGKVVLDEGDAVTFEPGQNAKGRRAMRVRR